MAQNLSEELTKPGAIKRTITGEKITPRRVIRERITKSKFSTTFASSQNSSFERLCWYSLKTGTKAALVAPSPIKSRKKIGDAKGDDKGLRHSIDAKEPRDHHIPDKP